MPDQYGRLSRAEMQLYVLRNLAVYLPGAVNLTTGYESGTPLLGANSQFTMDNINGRLNSSLTKASRIVIAASDKLLRQEVFFDAIPEVFEYAIPPDCIQVNSLWWLDPSIDSTVATPENYSPMSMQETFTDGGLVTGVNASRPTWRIVGNVVQLNEDPGDWLQATKAQGIWFKYSKRIGYLTADTGLPTSGAYIQFPFANEIQEFIVWDTTLTLLQTQEESVDTTKIESSVSYWGTQISEAANQFYRPSEMQMRGPTIVANTFSGRVSGRGNQTFEWR